MKSARTSAKLRPANPRGRPGAGRQPLTRDRIARAALELIEANGLDEMSTRKLGAALGCEAMALYNHFPSKEAVLDGVVELLIAKVELPPREVCPFFDRVRGFARSFRALSQVYPRAFPLLATRTFNTPSSLARLDAIFGEIADAGYSTQEAAYLVRIIGNYACGTGLDELSRVRFAARQTAAVATADVSLPNLGAALPYMGPAHFDAVFEAGLDAILQGFHRSRAPGIDRDA